MDILLICVTSSLSNFILLHFDRPINIGIYVSIFTLGIFIQHQFVYLIECFHLFAFNLNIFHFFKVNSFIKCTFEMGFNTLTQFKTRFQIHNSDA